MGGGGQENVSVEGREGENEEDERGIGGEGVVKDRYVLRLNMSRNTS